jgi:homoserine dehydrogenase
MDEVETKYFLRFMAMDQPGVLARISGVLGREEISIASVIQKGRRKAGPVPIVMLTHKASEGKLRRALRDIDRLTVLREKTVLLRVEEDAER